MWYKAASLFVYPAVAEGFGIPPIEAGATGIPCVCSNRTAMGDFKFFNDNLVDPMNLDNLKNQIIKNLKQQDKGLLSEIQKQIYSTYNWRSIASNYYVELKRYFAG